MLELAVIGWNRLTLTGPESAAVGPADLFRNGLGSTLVVLLGLGRTGLGCIGWAGLGSDGTDSAGLRPAGLILAGLCWSRISAARGSIGI